MKQYSVNKAYSSLMNLSELMFPYKKSREIYKLINVLKEIVEFGAKEQLKIIKDYNGEMGDDGSFNFTGIDKEERTRNCFNDLKKLNESEVDLEITPIILTEAECETAWESKNMITPADMSNLEGFIIFE